MLLYDEKTLHWPLTTHCWGAQGCRGNIEAEILYQCTGGNLAITSNYVLTILALIVLENGKVISTLYHGKRLGPLSVP